MTFEPHLLVPHDGTVIDGRAWEVERKIQEGDPHLILTWDAPREQWIVIRKCEDGRIRPIARWPANELETIPRCLEIMWAGATGRIESAVDRIEKQEAKLEKEASDRFRDKYGEMLEHAIKLHLDTTGPKTTFRGIPGRRKD